MRTRRCATIRRPACSIMALIAPVRFRAVASGLMIEKVRSTAIVLILCKKPAHDPAREGGGLIAAKPRGGKFAASREIARCALDEPWPLAKRLNGHGM